MTSVVRDGSTVERSFTYDAAGNPTSDNRNGSIYGYVYNQAGRLAQLTVGGTARATYTYDALERLATRSLVSGTPTGTKHYLYDTSNHLIAEMSAAGAPLREYVWLNDVIVGAIDLTGASPKYYYVHNDHQGRPSLMTNAAKQVVWEAIYKPFGEIYSIIGSASMDAMYPGLARSPGLACVRGSKGSTGAFRRPVAVASHGSRSRAALPIAGTATTIRPSVDTLSPIRWAWRPCCPMGRVFMDMQGRTPKCGWIRRDPLFSVWEACFNRLAAAVNAITSLPDLFRAPCQRLERLWSLAPRGQRNR